MSVTRARRPTPERTHPDRGILGVFGQNTWRGPSDYGHPLGPGFDEDPSQDGAEVFHDPDMRAASDLIDQHIAAAAQERAAEPDGLIGTLTDLYASANGGDLTKVVAGLTRAYADVASKWVDLASTVVEGLGQLRSQPAAASGTSGLGAAGPVLSLRAAVPVEARIEMFRAALALRAQPLGSDDPAISARITDVVVEDGRLKLRIPAGHPPGTYYGLLIEEGAGPAGVVTVQVFEDDIP